MMKIRTEPGCYLVLTEPTEVACTTLASLLKPLGSTAAQVEGNLRNIGGEAAHPTRCPLSVYLREHGLSPVFVGHDAVEWTKLVEYGEPLPNGRVNRWTGNIQRERREYRVRLPLPPHVIAALATFDGRPS